ncbi:MAG: glycosyltransferase family 1 protein, partial [Anaerolineae bacterium]|nr:glycosyltransferase family 1 protein [Anaerolineae bacterium]
MLRIALFTETFLPKVDGVVNTLCHLLDYFAECGYASLLFAPEGAPARYAQTNIVTWKGIRFPLYPELQIVPPLVDPLPQLSEFQPDLVHLVNPVSLGLAGLRAARHLRVPVVASYQTDIPGFARRWGLGLFAEPLLWYLRWLHNQCDLNLTPSRFTQCELIAVGYQRVKVWKRGVDTAHYRPDRRSSEWRWRLSGGHPAAPLLLYVGRLAPEKRVEWLWSVLHALPQARLAIVGDGPLRPSLEKLFAGTPTVFTGYLRGDDLANAYAAADVFVFPSPNETLGNVVLEAMASGLPVVAPRSGGLL